MPRLDLPPWSLHETRAGAGTPVALVHGLSGSSAWFRRNVDAIAAKHLVAAVDLVGFGRSRRFLGLPAVLPPFEEAAALLARWLETFGEPVHLVGHSMGGELSIRVAAERPELVRSLLLVSAAGIPFELKPLAHVKPLPRPPYGGPGIARVLLPDFFRAGPASVAVASARLLRSDAREAMHALRVPTLIVWGEGDPLVPLRYGEAMQREIAGSRLIVIPRAAHVAMWDAPEEFNRIALSFFDQVEASERVEARPGLFGWGIRGWSEGMAWREAGGERDIILVHGLGMSSAYFEPLARALSRRGWSPIAPDLPGFGESNDAPAGGGCDHARVLAAWADRIGLRDAVWLGHSTGCNAVAQLARRRPDLVTRAVHVGPLWTGSRRPSLRFAPLLALDALREPLQLYRYVVPAYWRAGLARWAMTWWRCVPELFEEPPGDAVVIAGERDPIPDRRHVPDIVYVPGAHACVVSHPDEVAKAVGSR